MRVRPIIANMLLSAQNISHAFGADDLFSELTVRLEEKERVGLVGPNGVGKTTLLLILAGLFEPDEGEIHRQKEMSLGYLRQEAVLTFAGQENSIYEEMLTVFAELVAYETEMRQMEARMTAGEMGDSLFQRYGEVQEIYETAGGYDYQVAIKQVLEGLGFAQESWNTPLNHLSGGQKTRVLLGRLLLEKPDLLILDEPTNHLDAAAVAWLEKTLQKWPGTLLIVSHDRYFLDRVANRIWSMTAERIKVYKGNYTTFVRQRQLTYERELKLFTAEKERLTKELEFVRKHIAGGKTDIAKGKLKRLTRDIVLLEEVGVLGREGKSWSEIGGRVRTFSANEAARRLGDLRPPDNRPPRLNIRLQSEEESEFLVLRTQRLQIGYPDAMLFKTEKLRLERRDCVAILGGNGSGKSTMLKTLLGEIDPLRGEITYGDNLKIGYFAQAHEQLDPEKKVIEEVLTRYPVGEQKARQHLAAYLFRGHDVFKSVADLSGGERGRLALALLALEGANLLLLDEPTNHLDIPAQEVLQETLERFDGTMLLVSHDRYLVSQLATQIWEIDGEEMHVFEGTYGEFMGEETETGDTAGRGEKVALEPTMPLSDGPLDLSWVQDLAEPIFIDDGAEEDDDELLFASEEMNMVEPSVVQRGRGRGNREEVRIQAYLDKLYEELATAEAAGDTEEMAWLEGEIDEAQMTLDDLGA